MDSPAVTPQALSLCVEVMVDCLPDFGQPKALLTTALGVDMVYGRSGV